MSYRNAAVELNKNIQIMESTFEANNLQVLGTACKPYADDDGDLILYIEVASISGSKIKNSVQIKVNLYNKDNSLYMSKSTWVSEDKFSGYDTFEIQCYDSSHTLDIAVKGRLYVTR